MKYFYIYILSLILISCSNNSKYTLFRSEIIDYNFTIPKQYKEITPTNYLFKLVDSNEEKNLVNLNSAAIENLLNLQKNFNLLYDTTNYNNNLIITEGEYIDLSTGVGSKYLGLFEEALYENWNTLNIAYNKLESKYVHHKQTEYIKIKYERISNKKKNYFTQYILSSQKRTLSIIFNTNSNIDYEEIIKPIDLSKKEKKAFKSHKTFTNTVKYYIDKFSSKEK